MLAAYLRLYPQHYKQALGHTDLLIHPRIPKIGYLPGKKAIEHLDKAANKYHTGHYMGEVARVHLELLKKKKS